jgi:hypothetical protein
VLVAALVAATSLYQQELRTQTLHLLLLAKPAVE